jgi:hypothetical protein
MEDQTRGYLCISNVLLLFMRKGTLKDVLPAFPGDLLLGMANFMLSPIDWNVEFQTKTENEETRSLYVYRFVLSARSEYYKTSSNLN